MRMDSRLIVMEKKEYSYSSDYCGCMDVNVKSMNWTSCSKMSRVSVLLYSVSLNNKMKQWAFTLLDLVLWRRFSGGGVLDFGLDGDVPPGPRDPNPCLE